jgi:LPXTG-motif cell wall-anchored protein
MQPSAPPAVVAGVARPGAPTGGSDSTALVVGGTLLVVALGAGTGVLLRRRARP